MELLLGQYWVAANAAFPGAYHPMAYLILRGLPWHVLVTQSWDGCAVVILFSSGFCIWSSSFSLLWCLHNSRQMLTLAGMWLWYYQYQAFCFLPQVAGSGGADLLPQVCTYSYRICGAVWVVVEQLWDIQSLAFVAEGINPLDSWDKMGLLSTLPSLYWKLYCSCTAKVFFSYVSRTCLYSCLYGWENVSGAGFPCASKYT